MISIVERSNLLVDLSRILKMDVPLKELYGLEFKEDLAIE
tara:strand:+ start:108 stop:227 length:120 start_codon:yes stop_codon:yes gene_type:complete